MNLNTDTKDTIGILVWLIGWYMGLFTMYWLIAGKKSYWQEFLSMGGYSRHGAGLFSVGLALLVLYGLVAVIKSIYRDYKQLRK